MNTAQLINGLEKNHAVFKTLFDLTSKALITYKPKPDQWCFLEIVCHLNDEEKEDFRARVKHALATPNKTLSSISPKTWPIERGYLIQDYNATVSDFLQERNTSVQWLKNIKNGIWTNAVDVEVLGKMSAFDFLSNWLAHDYLHIRQLNALKYQFLKSKSDTDLTYAGNW